MQTRHSQQRKYFLLSEYLIIAMLAAMGLAAKVIIVPLAHLITGPLFIPGGVLAGGFFMMFLLLAAGITQKRGAALFVSLIQAVLVTVGGSFGSHGAASLFTYSAAGLGAELVFLLSGHRGCCAPCCFLGGLAANLAGTLAVNLAVFKLPPIPLLLSLSVAALSGGLGGLIANVIAKKLREELESKELTE